MLEFEVSNEGYAKIIVVGIGGGGCNAVDRMIQDKVEGVSFISINTDKQVLDRSLADTKLQIVIFSISGFLLLFGIRLSTTSTTTSTIDRKAHV